MKMLRMKIVIPANTEFTMPTPMSARTAAASGILSGSFSASSSSLPVMSYLSFRLLSVSFSLTKSVTSCAYSGALLPRSSAWLTSPGMMQGADAHRNQDQRDVDGGDRQATPHPAGTGS